MRNKGNKKHFYLYINSRINKENMDLLLSRAGDFMTADVLKFEVFNPFSLYQSSKRSPRLYALRQVQERELLVVETDQVWNLF